MEATVMTRQKLRVGIADRIQKPVGIYLTALLAFWALALVGQYLWAHAMGQPFSPKMLFLKNAKDAFDDFTMFNPLTNRFGTDTELLVYPAPMMCGYVLFFRLFANPLAAYEAMIVVFGLGASAVFTYFLSKGSRHRVLLTCAVFGSLFLSFPLMFTMERANTEAMVFFVQVAAITAFVTRRYMLAGLLIGLAAAMKLYPALLLFLLLSKKKYKELAVACLAIVAFNLVALWVVGPSMVEAAKDVVKGMGLLGATHIFHLLRPDLGFDHSLFSMVKQGSRILLRDEPDAQMTIASASLPYAVLIGAAFLVLYWFVLRKMPIVNQIIALGILSTLMPPLSMEYTLIQLYIPWALFLIYLVREDLPIPFYAAAVMMICFAFIFAPATYLSGRTIAFGGQLKSLAMLTIVFLTCRIPMPSALFGEVSRPAR